MPHRLKLTVAYDGAPFSGWQSQANHNGIQDHLERAFERIAGQKVRVHGSGRTDAGVHALAQCAHVDLATLKLRPARLVVALNALLPPTIRILRCGEVSGDFHARYSAKGKIYRYRIFRGPVLPPFEHGRAWHVMPSLDMALVQSAALLFVGKHDFAGFAANSGQFDTDTTRTLFAVRVRCGGPHVTIEFDGDGFLYKMVRLAVGAIVQCGLGKTSRKEISERLLVKKDHRPMRLVAPANGLFLVRVRY